MNRTLLHARHRGAGRAAAGAFPFAHRSMAEVVAAEVVDDGAAWDAARARGLWSAVLLTAIDDARGHGSALDQVYARRWLGRGSGDFRRVCWLAGVDPEDVQARMRAEGVI